MLSLALSLLACATLGHAQSASGASSTVSLIVPLAGSGDGLVGSIAGSDASATTYVVTCSSSASQAASASGAGSSASASASDEYGGYGDIDTEQCGFAKPQTIVQGASTLHFVYSDSMLDAAETVDCKLMGTTQAICSGTTSGTGSALSAATSVDFALPGSVTATLNSADLAQAYQEVVITAGPVAGASSSGAGKMTMTGSSKAVSNTGSSAGSSTGSSTGSSIGSSASTAGSSTQSASTAKSTGGAMLLEPALGVSAVAMLVVGLAAFVL